MPVIAMLCALFFSCLGFIVTNGSTRWIDESILRIVHSLSTPLLTNIVTVLTWLGDPRLLLPVGIVLGVAIAQKAQYTRAAIAAILLSGSGLVTGITKSVFDRMRPELWPHTVKESSFSFPSGHANTSMIIVLTLIWLFPTLRKPIYLVGFAIYLVVVGFTRLYLGVHYPTDILGGWLLAAFWAAIVLSIARYSGRASK